MRRRGITRPPTEVVGRSVEPWVNEKTGETVALEAVKRRGRGGHPYLYAWVMVSNEALEAALDGLGNPAQKLLVRLAIVMCDGNLIVATQREVAKRAGIAEATASHAMQVLKEQDHVRAVGRGLMLNPHLAWRGATAGLHAAMKEWDQQESESEGSE